MTGNAARRAGRKQTVVLSAAADARLGRVAEKRGRPKATVIRLVLERLSEAEIEKKIP